MGTPDDPDDRHPPPGTPADWIEDLPTERKQVINKRHKERFGSDADPVFKVSRPRKPNKFSVLPSREVSVMIGVFVPVRIRDEIVRLARDSNRSVSGYVRHVLEQEVPRRARGVTTKREE